MSDEPKPWWKFDECETCKLRNRPRTCKLCDNGEYFQEEDPEAMDGILRFEA